MPPSVGKRRAHSSPSGLALVAALALGGCGADAAPPSGAPALKVDVWSAEKRVERVDILFALDNSRSMADKQSVLALAVPDLVQRLVNPRCVDSISGEPSVDQPTGPLEPCPDLASERDFPPILDVHIGVISSSLGGFGSSSACAGTTFDDESNHTENDAGHLLARLSPYATATAPTYQGKGFLAWDPTQSSKTPPGEESAEQLIGTLSQMVLGVGQVGCGYEAQLESWYRFLVDPEPYEALIVEDGKTTPVGVDKVIVGERDEAGNIVSLGQRAEFLRPDSLLAVVMLTDENDCSIRESGQGHLAAEHGDRLWRPRAACADDPNSPCCRSCAQPPGSDADGLACPDEPACYEGGEPARLSLLEDPANLRCFDQKRRFGVDFLHDTQRYVRALQELTVADRHGNLVPNPLFTDLNPADSYWAIRDPYHVVLAGIVGVPWQDIARTDATGAPDLVHGLDAWGQPVGGFMDASELSEPRVNGASTWDLLLGDSEGGEPPLDPFMRESIDPRSGTNPITGDPITSSPDENSINGHEYTPSGARNDLQYACVAPLLPQDVRDCADGPLASCDCKDPSNDSPLCAANDSGERTLQVRAKAYPGLRELGVLRALRHQGIVGSVCPKQLHDPGASDFGYRPAIGALIERLRPAILEGGCMRESLEVAPSGRIDCVLLEGTRVGTCDCAAAGRRPLGVANLQAMAAASAAPITAARELSCFCEIIQPEGEDIAACQHEIHEPVRNASGAEVHGFCYIDAHTSPPTGNPALLATCPATEQRNLRFVGQGAPASGATLFLACQDD